MRICPERGFTLIEILVALLVLALGTIGGAAMQLTALRTRHQSALLSNAVQLASSIADTMRANADQMQRADSDNSYLDLHYDAATEALPAAPAALCFSGVRCTSAQLASFDIHEIKQQIRGALPGGRLVICRDINSWNSQGLSWSCTGLATEPIVIKLGWRGKNQDGTPLQDDFLRDSPSVAVRLTSAAR